MVTAVGICHLPQSGFAGLTGGDGSPWRLVGCRLALLLLLVANPRVQIGVGEVGQQDDDHAEGSQHDVHPADIRVVSTI